MISIVENEKQKKKKQGNSSCYTKYFFSFIQNSKCHYKPELR